MAYLDIAAVRLRSMPACICGKHGGRVSHAKLAATDAATDAEFSSNSSQSADSLLAIDLTIRRD